MKGKPLFIAILIMGLLAGCKKKGNVRGTKQQKASSSISIIPKPVSVKPQKGKFNLTPATFIQIPVHSKESSYAGSYLRKKIHASTGYNIAMGTKASPADTSRILLTLSSDTVGFGNNEGYTLHVTPKEVEITAPTPQGLFYGVQSLLQLFPPEILQADYELVPQNTKWTAPAVKIKDYPRFHYRGMQLDVARHFEPVWFVKRYIDMMAMYKYNTFHWHLTGDQGWRIQIKKYPKLTEIGAWRDSTLIGHKGKGNAVFDHERTGGFYTQKQIREVVAYAKKRFVTVIPEIEMPGHSSAALAAYPKLGCRFKGHIPFHVRSTWGIFKTIFCPSDYTFNFLENVLTEVMDLFPSKYIHIGGDEAPKTAWKKSPLAQHVMKREGLKNEKQLQSYFISRMEKFLNDHGRSIIGWDEILEGGLAPNATVESWRGIKGGIKAAQQHHDVIMTPNHYCYLNYYQANPKTEPIAQGGFIPLKKVYNYNPIPDTLTKEQSKYIIGVEANLWGEYIATPRKAEYMAYPRALALAEVNWSSKNEHNWNNFWKRLQPQFKRFDVLGIDYGKHYKGQKPHLKRKK
jgi:hexosaminidase